MTHVRTTTSGGRRLAVALGILGALVVGAAAPAAAVSTDLGNRVVSDDPANWTPQVMDGSVKGIVQIGDRLVAVGNFTRVRQSLDSPDLVRNGVFAFDATTGVIDPGFNPNLGSGSANSVDTDGTYVYVGGSFGSVGGSAASRRVVRLTAGGIPVPGLDVPNSAVNEVVVRGDRLFIGGGFTSVSGSARAGLAALDTTTGDVLPGVDGAVHRHLQRRQHHRSRGWTSTPPAPGSSPSATSSPWAASRASRSPWSTPPSAAPPRCRAGPPTATRGRCNSCASVFNTFMRDVDFSPDGTFFAVNTTGAFAGGASSGTLCDTATRWETATGTGPAADLGGLHRWRHQLRDRGRRRRRLHRRAHALAEQLLPGRPGRSRGGAARGHRRARRRQRAAAVVEPGPGPRGRRRGAVHDAAGPVGRQRHQPHRRRAPPADRVPAPRRWQHPARPSPSPRLPGDLFLAERTSAADSGVLYRINAGGGTRAQRRRRARTGPAPSMVSGGNDATWSSGVPLDAHRAGGDAVRAVHHRALGGPELGPPGDGRTRGAGAPVLRQPVRRHGVRRPARLRRARRGCPGAGRLRHRRRGRQPPRHDAAVHGDQRRHRRHRLRRTWSRTRWSTRSRWSTRLGWRRRDRGRPAAPTRVRQAGRRPAPATTASTALDWTTTRGATVVGGTLYYGLPDGNLYARSFDPDHRCARRTTHGRPVRRPRRRRADPVRRREPHRHGVRRVHAPPVLHAGGPVLALLPLLHAGERGRGRADLHRPEPGRPVVGRGHRPGRRADALRLHRRRGAALAAVRGGSPVRQPDAC